MWLGQHGSVWPNEGGGGIWISRFWVIPKSVSRFRVIPRSGSRFWEVPQSVFPIRPRTPNRVPKTGTLSDWLGDLEPCDILYIMHHQCSVIWTKMGSQKGVGGGPRKTDSNGNFFQKLCSIFMAIVGQYGIYRLRNIYYLQLLLMHFFTPNCSKIVIFWYHPGVWVGSGCSPSCDTSACSVSSKKLL